MKSRYLTPILLKKSHSEPSRIIVLTGARQTGKTTIARKCFQHYAYLSLEDPMLRSQYSRLTGQQWYSQYPKAILDEVQKEPSLIESIKSVYDQYPEPRYILLGSSQLLLLNKVKESLAGRCNIQEIMPLTIPEIMTQSWEEEVKPSFLQEFLKSKTVDNSLPHFNLYTEYHKRKSSFEYYLKNGGYPALVNDKLTDDERFEWLTNYVKTYLERDIRDLADFRSLEPFVQVQRITAMLTGQLVNFTYLGKNAGVSSKTVQRFLQYLGISYQTILLQPWYKNQLKRLVKSPKLHYLDPGVQKAILQKTGTLTGNEFESAVVAEIYKQCKQSIVPANLFFLRTSDGLEIDLLIELEEGYMGIEIKMANLVNKTDARNLLNLDNILDKPLIKCFVLSNDEEIKEVAKNIIAMPASMFLS